MRDAITTVAEAIALLAIASGVALLVFQAVALWLALIVFGVVILAMSAAVTVAASRKGGTG